MTGSVVKYIKVNTKTIAANARLKLEGRVDALQPAIEVVSSDAFGVPARKQTGYEVEILGPCRVIQNDQHETFGARVWIETESEVRIL